MRVLKKREDTKSEKSISNSQNLYILVLSYRWYFSKMSRYEDRRKGPRRKIEYSCVVMVFVCTEEFR